MSCEIRSMITRYPLGSAIFTPPSFTNSADTPSTFVLLIFSTTAGGKVFSMPNKIPIFFITALLYRRCLQRLTHHLNLYHSDEESGFSAHAKNPDPLLSSGCQNYWVHALQ